MTTRWLARCVLVAMLAAATTPASAAGPAISAGLRHSLAIHSDGSVRSWGSDDSGMLGLGRTLEFANPRTVSGLGARRVTAISASDNHVLVLTAEGEVWGWGDNPRGQLGDGTRSSSAIPVRAAGLPVITMISAGGDHSAALAADGSVWTWGANGAGALGDDTPPRGDRPLPARLAGLPRMVAVWAGFLRTFASADDGSLWAWGVNFNGELGDGTNTDRPRPIRIAGIQDVINVTATSSYTLAITRDGTVWSWGTSAEGALGAGTVSSRATPARIVGLTGFVRVSSGLRHAAALKADGTAWTWGANESGQLGDGGVTGNATPRQVAGITGVTVLAAGGLHTLARRSDGTLWGWGSNYSCEMALCGATAAQLMALSPRQIVSFTDVQLAAAGVLFSLAVRADGSVVAWGLNANGQLANNAAIFRTTPSRVAGLASIVGIAAGPRHSVAVRSDGTVFAWGNNFVFQAGDDALPPLSTPETLSGLANLTGATAVAAGVTFSLALRGDGSVWAWGGNFDGQLGVATPPARGTALPVPGIQDATAIAAGQHAMALRRDGTVLSWGINYAGQLGDGTTTARFSPRPVTGLADIVAISAGVESSAAVGRDGSVWTWGGNAFGQLGDGTLTGRPLPVRVAGLPPIASVAVGYSFTAALARDGTVWAWGRNEVGELGDGGSANRLTPARVPGVDNIVAIAAGASTTLALRGDGTLLGWGYNSFGQLGDGTIAVQRKSVAVVRELGAGSVASNDWFLSLGAATAPVPDKVPVFSAVASAVDSGLNLLVKPKAADVGTTTNLYLFALAPQTIVRGAVTSQSLTGAKAKGADGKDTPVSCVLAQLSRNGEMIAVTSANLEAYLTGVLGSQGAAASILAGVPPSNTAGATIFVGYGPSGTTMINTGTNRAIATLEGPLRCEPQAPQKGWWWNPLEDGRGFSLEVRGNNMFFASFLYDISGRSTWYVSSGPASMEGSFYSGDLLSARGGQSLGGAYPGFPSLRTEGNVTLAFNSASQGTMIWPGGTVPIQRFNIVQNGVTQGAATNMPESGWWWNDQESGRGFFMEWQGNSLDIAGYMYDDAGNPVWYLTVGEQTADGRTFTGSWWSYGNGQTLTGAWRPNARLSTTVAPLSVTFSAPDTALMTLPNGRTTALRRHRF